MAINKIIVIFTEGETDEVFYKRLCNYLRIKTIANIKIVIKNLKGVGRYESKASAILKHQIISKYPKTEIVVFCSYDLDVFGILFQQKPPVDWKKVETKLRNIGINKIYHLKADNMIEDWFLIDLEGLSKFLKIKQPKKLKGNNAYEKIRGLFKKANKIYQKGSNVHRFVEFLDIVKIYKSLDNQFDKLKEEINRLVV